MKNLAGLEVEIVIEPNRGLGIPQDGSEPYVWDGLRVAYRRADQRQWQRFSIIGDDEQSLRDLALGAIEAVGSFLERDQAAA